jgi:peptidoglycan/LPS O-acetylase OafA/YrhL
VDGVYWSLLVEVRFYLLLWLLYYVMKIRQPVWIIAAMGLLAPLNMETQLISKSNDFFLYLCFFAFGMAYSGCLRRIAYARLSLVFSFLVFSLISLMGSRGVSMSLSAENYIYFVYCFLIFLAAMSLFKNKSNPWISYLGLLSYPLYLLHQDIGLISIKLLEAQLPHLPAAFITAGWILLLAAAVQRLVDKRMERMKAWVRNYSIHSMQLI